MGDETTAVGLLPATARAEPGALLPVDEQATLLDALDVAAEQYLGERARPNTARAYRDDWRTWLVFTGYLGVDPDTARLGLMVAYVEWLVRQQAAPNTIDRRLSGVVVTLDRHGVEVPRRITRAARAALSAYKHELAEKGEARGRGQAVPIRVAHLRTICLHLDAVIADPDTSDRDRLLALRDKALVLMGFGLAARRSELAGLHAPDVEASAEGLLITIRASKSSEDAATVPVLRGTARATCPLRAWLAWDAAVRAHQPGRSRAFVDLDRRAAGLRWLPELSGHDVGAVITRVGRAAGLEVELTGHSLRAGLATEARRAGHDFKTIATQGRWSPRSTEPYRYMRIVDQWADNATAGLGL